MITLEKILKILKEDDNFVTYDGDLSINFDKLSYDSRKLTDTTLFFVKGGHFKKEYLSALTTPVYISEIDYQIDAMALIVKDIKRAMSLIALEFYQHPEKQLKILAFTGTKGKTTSAYFSKYILDKMNGGKTALLSTAYSTLDGQTFFKSDLTTPESLDLLHMIDKCVKNGMTHLVMEVSSQAYKTERVSGLTFDVGVFLNISPDHIGPLEHPNFEDYFACKRQLLDNSKFVIVNSESNRFKDLALQVNSKPHIFYGDHSDNKIVKSDALSFEVTGTVAGHYHIQLLGHFNQENALASALACQQLGATLKQIQDGLSEATVPGRMETIHTKIGAKIYIDYAHNGISLENLVNVVETHHTGKIFLVLGATGNKGESRRKDFGHVIEKHKRLEVILTQDDSNYEDPATIADDIKAYISRPVSFEKDRAIAIEHTIKQITNKNDVVIIAGKGDDHFQLINGIREPYPGDREVAEKFL